MQNIKPQSRCLMKTYSHFPMAWNIVAFAGMIVGQRVREMASPAVFRMLFFGGMLVLGTHLAFFHR